MWGVSMKFVNKKTILSSISIVVLFLCLIASGYWLIMEGIIFPSNISKLKLDMEYTHQKKPLNSATQSINRYKSKLRELDSVSVEYLKPQNRLSLTMQAEGQAVLVKQNIDAYFLTPILPYKHDKHNFSQFDQFNLMLAEYARNGVSLSHQASNKFFGSFSMADDSFLNPFAKEYQYIQGSDGYSVLPSEDVLPKRMSVTNNCLSPGLWEISANDSVGEMYHAWFSFPKQIYYEMVKENNDLILPNSQLRKALKYKENSMVPVDFDKLRKFNRQLGTSKSNPVMDKSIASYSSQDSRRKVQRGFFKVKRDQKLLDVERFEQLQKGDNFELYAFVSPGIYSPKKLQTIPFQFDWGKVEINEVKPLTAYAGNKSDYDKEGYIEMRVYSEDQSRMLVMGNIPISLLVYQEDYDIPALGVGVFPASEPIERRHLRVKHGPKPHYAYLLKRKNGEYLAVNNHEYGIEQFYLRPFKKSGKTYLRVNIVSYERIMDILEMEIVLGDELSEKIDRASSEYRRPTYRTYLDNNIL